MRVHLLMACTAVVLASVAACGSSDDATVVDGQDAGTDVNRDVDRDGGGDAAPSTSDGGAPDAAVSKCSEAGWCETRLPDADLVFKDIWPFGDRAFALAESATVGVRALEWVRSAEGTSDDEGWKYIDDGTQNEDGLGAYAGKIWAPDANEVYFTVAPGYVYHGTRGATPDLPWTWTRAHLADNTFPDDPSHDHGVQVYAAGSYANVPVIGVYGTSRDDVYAWYANTVFRWQAGPDGTPDWVAEYVLDDRDRDSEHVFVTSAGGTAGDVWFSGGRDDFPWNKACGFVVRKSSAGWERVADGIVPDDYTDCVERPDTLLVGGLDGWFTDVQLLGDGSVLGLKGARSVARISGTAGAETTTWAADLFPIPVAVSQTNFSSLWNVGSQTWVSSMGVVAVGTDVMAGGSYQVSTIALRGSPLNRQMYQVRGTSSDNLWVVGARYALHKTTL